MGLLAAEGPGARIEPRSLRLRRSLLRFSAEPHGSRSGSPREGPGARIEPASQPPQAPSDAIAIFGRELKDGTYTGSHLIHRIPYGIKHRLCATRVNEGS